MNKQSRNLPAAIGMFALATVLFLLPGSRFPSQGWLSPFLQTIFFDKWVHAILFFLLVFTWCRTSRFVEPLRNRKNKFLFILLFFIAYGVGIEFIQLHFIENRSFEIWDIVADSIGAIASYIFCVRQYIKKRPL